MINIHSTPFILTSLSFMLITIFVFCTTKDKNIGRSFLLLGISATLWQFPYFLAYNFHNKESILILFRIAYFSLAFITPAIYYFIASILGENRRISVIAFYVISVFLAVWAGFTTFVVSDVRIFPWGSCAYPGSGHLFFLGLWLLPALCGLTALYSRYKTTSKEEDRQNMKYLMIALLIAFLSLTDTITLYSGKIYPFGFVSLIAFVLILGWAIFRHNLTKGRSIKKITLISIGSGFAMGVIYILTWYLQPFLKRFGRGAEIVFPIVTGVLIGVMIFKFIEFVNALQVRDFSKKTAYRALFKKEARLLLAARTEKELYTYLIRDLSSWIGLTYAAIFVKGYGEHFFVLKKDFDRNRSQKTSEKVQIIFNDKPILELLKNEKNAVFVKDIADSKRGIFFKETNNLSVKAIIPIFSDKDLVAFIVLGEKIGKYKLTDDDLSLLMSLSKTVGRALNAFLLKREKARLVVAAQNTLIDAIEAKDGYTRGHTDRVAFYTVIIAEQMAKRFKINLYSLENLKWSAHLHDVGKIAIPDKILMKPAKLTLEEFSIIKEHPQSGLKIVSSVKEWLGDDVCYGIVQHHENYNGTGYPLGLSGENIHIFSRIIRVADSFDAMTTTRPYKASLSAEEALEELKKGKGTWYDPDVVDVFEQLYRSGRIFGEIQ